MMKNLLIVSFCFALLLPAFAQREMPVVKPFSAAAAKQVDVLNPEYLVFGPVDSDKPLPTVIYLHGGGGGGNDVKRIQGQPRGVYEAAKRHKVGTCLVVAPQCIRSTPAKRGIWTAKDLNVFMAEIKKTLPIDESRVYLTGNSMGGYGSWMWGGANPELFAAIVPVVGGIGPGGPKDVTPDLDAWAAKLATVPLWAFAGGKDRVVPAERSERMVAAIKKAGGTQAKITVFEDEGHNAGRLVWREKDAITWMFSKQRAVPAKPGARKGRPNVLFLAVDDMNDWIGCHGTTPAAITPNIDKLARRGVNFRNGHTAGVFCAPSRAAIFSGQFASTTGCYDTSLYWVDHPELRPLQVSFKEAGYKTMGGGKLFHHPAGQVDLRGWDEFFVRSQAQRESGYPMDSFSDEVPLPDPRPNSIYNRTPGGPPPNKNFMEWAAFPNEQEAAFADTIRAEWAVRRLQETHEQPFFLGLGLYAPHFPNYCPQKYWDLYERASIKLPPYKTDDLDDLPENIRKQKTNRSRIHQKLESIDAIPEALHAYLACMSYADALLGRVLDGLAASPYADNTIVVLWSDHGYHHGEKGDWGKHTLWERTSNVPFIWAGPGIASGVDSDVSVSLIDMYPTLVELCDLPETPQKLEGVSLAGTLADPGSAADRDIYLPHMFPSSYAIINRDWRFIRYKDGSEELYDLKKDPNEWHNLAGDRAFDAIRDRLRAKAPTSFAEVLRKRHRRDFIAEGETFRWNK